MKIFLRIPVFIFVAATAYSCNQQIQSKKPVVVENEGVKIAFSDTGKGEPALLFVHGWCIINRIGMIRSAISGGHTGPLR